MNSVTAMNTAQQRSTSVFVRNALILVMIAAMPAWFALLNRCYGS